MQHDPGQARGADAPARYVTTAIPYVNAPPHVGFALELCQADVLARHWRDQGYDVRLQAGTDENSLKNVLAAEAAAVAPEALVAGNAAAFRELTQALGLSVDDFIRTSADRRHRSGVEKLWAACAASGDIYSKDYEGLYCVGCEQFYKPDELSGGACPEHATPVERVAERNYFFRLSRYQAKLHELVSGGRIAIKPAARRNEVLGWIERGLEDFSISRSRARARGWGLPVPGDPDQVIYVWFDALGNYVTALGYGTGAPAFRRYWHEADRRVHVIGKGITRFHAVYWPAMLLSAGLDLPHEILVHGYVMVEGRKIAKSAGNAVDPRPIAGELGADALRFYLLRHVRSAEDGDFSRERLLRAYRSELAGQLGNLVHRVVAIAERSLGGVVAAADGGERRGALARAAADLPGAVAGCIEDYSFHEALARIFETVALANRRVAEDRPWEIAKRAAGTADPQDRAVLEARLAGDLHGLVQAIGVIGCALRPFLPATSERLLRQIGAGRAATATDILAATRFRAERQGVLFPPLD